jgi:hypothetical protein
VTKYRHLPAASDNFLNASVTGNSECVREKVVNIGGGVVELLGTLHSTPKRLC